MGLQSHSQNNGVNSRRSRAGQWLSMRNDDMPAMVAEQQLYDEGELTPLGIITRVETGISGGFFYRINGTTYSTRTLLLALSRLDAPEAAPTFSYAPLAAPQAVEIATSFLAYASGKPAVGSTVIAAVLIPAPLGSEEHTFVPPGRQGIVTEQAPQMVNFPGRMEVEVKTGEVTLVDPRERLQKALNNPLVKAIRQHGLEAVRQQQNQRLMDKFTQRLAAIPQPVRPAFLALSAGDE